MGIIVGTQETKDRVLSTEPGTQCMATQGHQALHAYTTPPIFARAGTWRKHTIWGVEKGERLENKSLAADPTGAFLGGISPHSTARQPLSRTGQGGRRLLSAACGRCCRLPLQQPFSSPHQLLPCRRGPLPIRETGNARHCLSQASWHLACGPRLERNMLLWPDVDVATCDAGATATTL